MTNDDSEGVFRIWSVICKIIALAFEPHGLPEWKPQ